MKYRAVIFDNDLLICDLIRSMLQVRNFEVFSQASPFICHNTNKNEECSNDFACSDLLIVKLNVLNMNYFEYIKHLRKTKCKIKHIGIMSDSWSYKNYHEIEKLGYKAFYKPVNWQEFSKWLDTCENKMRKQNSKTH